MVCLGWGCQTQAVAHGSNLIIVLGHELCGAVSFVMNPTGGGIFSHNLELVQDHLAHTCEQSKQFFKNHGGETAVECAIELNVIRQCEHLLEDRVIAEACNHPDENTRLHIVRMKYYLNDNNDNEHFLSLLYHYPKDKHFEQVYHDGYLANMDHKGQEKLHHAMKRGVLVLVLVCSTEFNLKPIFIVIFLFFFVFIPISCQVG